MAVDPTTESKEKQDAEDAKKDADPKVNDPAFMPNIEPQTGGAKKKKPAVKKTSKASKSSSKSKSAPKADRAETKKPKASSSGIWLDPNLPLIPGNSVTFVTEEREGRVTAKIETGGLENFVNATNGYGDARVSKILERSGEITVTFYEDGKQYASGTWPIA